MAPGSRPAATEHAPERQYGKPESGLRLMLYTIIFEADTRAGRAFDVALLAAILVSVAVVILDSVDSISSRYRDLFQVLEWGFTLLFTVGYAARLWCVRHPSRYAGSFFGIVEGAAST